MSHQLIRIFLINDNLFAIQAIKSSIQQHGGELVGTESGLSNPSILRSISKARAEILIITVDTFSSQDERVIKSIKKANTNLGIIIVAKKKKDIPRLIKWEVNGYLLISEGLHELVKTIKCVYCAQSYYSLEVARILARKKRGSESLTPRETQVYLLLKRKKSKRQISQMLGICVSTVRTYVFNIKFKLGPNCIDNQLLS